MSDFKKFSNSNLKAVWHILFFLPYPPKHIICVTSFTTTYIGKDRLRLSYANGCLSLPHCPHTYNTSFENESVQILSLDNGEDEPNFQSSYKIPFQQVQDQVSGLVADYTLHGSYHKEIFDKMTDGICDGI